MEKEKEKKVMGKMKRIFAWLLSLAMVFGLLGGQVSVAKAAGYGIYSYALDSKELPSEGGELVATIKFDDFSHHRFSYHSQMHRSFSRF